MTMTERPVAGTTDPPIAREPGSAPQPEPQAAPDAKRLLRSRAALSTIGWAALGLAGVVALWAVAASRAPDLPTPVEGWETITTLLADPFYDNGPNDKGIGAQVLVSLQRVFSGFALATLVGVPLGFLIGANRRAWKAVNPVVQLLRPVSPLAWYPLGLLVLKNAPGAAVFVIFITALWPTVVNTAAGAASVPADHRNVARVFRLGAPAYVRHVLVPHTLPSVVTGLRLSMGVAWMVIVAVEMLSGGTGIGFFVWNSYNGGNFGNLIAAIVLIGTVGLALDALFNRLARRAVIEEVAP